MRSRARRWAAAVSITVVALVALYAAAGFLLAPHLAKRELVRYAESLGQQGEVAGLRFNPFTCVLEATGLKLVAQDGRPVATMDRAYADFDCVSVVQRAWRFSDVAIEGAALHVERDRDGGLNLERLAQRATPRPPAQSQGDRGLPAVVVETLTVERAALHYADRSRETPWTFGVSPIAARITGLTTLPGESARYTLEASLPGRASLAAKGRLALAPVASEGEIALGDLALSTVWPFVSERLNLDEPGGTATLQARYRYGGGADKSAFAVSDAALDVRGLRLALRGAEQPLLALARAHVGQASYDAGTRAFAAGTVALADGSFLAALDAEGRFNWSRIAAPAKDDARGAPWRARIDSAKLDAIAVRYEDHTRRAPLALDIGAGHATLALTLDSDGEATRTLAERVALDLKGVALTQAGSGTALVTVESAALAGGRVDTGERLIAAESTTLSGGRAALMRERDGAIALVQAWAPARPAGPAEGAPWRYRIGAATVQDTALAVGDAGYEPALRYDVQVERLALQGVDSGGETPIAFAASARVAQGGTLAAEGSASQDYSRANARITLSALGMQPLQGVLDRYVTLAVRSGHASAAANVEYARDATPMLRVTGGAKLAEVALDDTRTGQRFLSLAAIGAEGLTLTLGPDRLDVKEVLVDRIETAVHISRERKVNLAQILKDPASAQPAAVAPAEPRAAAQDAPAFPVRVGRLRLQNGTVDFSDASLVLPFSTRVTRVGGTVVGLANDPQARAEIKLGGRIEPSGYASAEGGVNVLHPTQFMDLNVKFQNVQLSPLSPYTATFAGRKIDSGRVWLDLDYRIVDRQLSGANKVVLENVVLGERVQAPDAMDLPLDLAIALLKDSQGRITMTVPVSGDIDNPQFSYGALIREAIASAIGRIVSAPFRALASLFGGGNADQLSTVRFSPGSARVYPPQREGLQKVAKALQERPQLKVVVHAPYDPQRDADRLKRDPVRRELAQAMGQALKPGEDPGPVPYSDPQTQEAIARLYVARAGRDALQAYAAAAAQQYGKPAAALEGDQRRAYYEGLFERLVQSYPLPDTALRELAVERAQAIAGVLIESGVDASRVEVGPLRTVTDGTEPTIDAELALAARG